MTIKECIDLVDASKPNQYSLEEKVGWLSFLDGTIINDVLKTHEGYDGSYDLFEGYSTERLTAELIAPSPYDRLYPAYLKMRIDSENGEIARYNNSAALYNVYLMEYKKWYNRTHMPISGAVIGGVKNVVGGCGCGSNADVAEKAAISAEEARQSAVRASEKAEEASVSAVRAESAKASVDNTRLEVYSIYRAVDERAAATREAADEVNAVARGFSEAEAKRVTAEGLRVSAENARVIAENQREREMRELAQRVEDALEGSGGGFRKIGFTEDCDFVATEGDGLTAFQNALEAATDGETILVMPGVYEGAERFEVTKNVNFIGIGRPEIDFTVWISGGGIIEDWVIVGFYPSITSRWTGFDLWGGFEVGCEYDPDGNGGEGCGIIEDCEVSGNLNLTGGARNCYIRVDTLSSGHYYGWSATAFNNCYLRVKNYFEMNGGSFINCEIYPSSSNTYEYFTNALNASFNGCRIYTLGASFEAYNQSGSNVNLGDSLVFANSISGCDGGYLVKPTAN